MCHMLRTIIASGSCLSRNRFKLVRGLAYAAVTGLSGVSASSQTAVKIVGIGAVPCSEFIRESEPDPVVEKYFFGWAQGYISGLLRRAPAGVDEGVGSGSTGVPDGGTSRFPSSILRSASKCGFRRRRNVAVSRVANQQTR